jgi:hypothetical protein
MSNNNSGRARRMVTGERPLIDKDSKRPLVDGEGRRPGGWGGKQLGGRDGRRPSCLVGEQTFTIKDNFNKIGRLWGALDIRRDGVYVLRRFNVWTILPGIPLGSKRPLGMLNFTSIKIKKSKNQNKIWIKLTLSRSPLESKRPWGKSNFKSISKALLLGVSPLGKRMKLKCL